ncbi:MAG: heme-binding protein [Crocinitomicaceae bacterium]|jgi:hypothetical protein|nr:heme-binding protein [Crocinitomicaceae bacterium]MBT6515500.1 heme-binding protein [Crocinitomicaceae bacterium]
MKIFLIIFVSLCIVFFTLQGFIMTSTSNTEKYQYEVVKEYDDFEVRKYQAALFSSVDLSGDSYESNSGTGFRILAGYIFGGNQTGEKIAMTSPVAMQLNDSNRKMSFMVPSNYDKKRLPTPNNESIYFEEKKECMMAAIRFGGWANDKKIEAHVTQLKKYLEKEGLAHKNNFSYFGYNPPYEVVNRRNEVVVELTE